MKGRRIVRRDRIVGTQLLYKDYFQPKPKFHDGIFFLVSLPDEKTLVPVRGGGRGGI